VQAPETQGDGKKQLTARERQVRALKIGAAAAGGGAILALTGMVFSIYHLHATPAKVQVHTPGRLVKGVQLQNCKLFQDEVGNGR